MSQIASTGGLFGLSKDENQPEVGLETAGRIIHHIPWERQKMDIIFYSDADRAITKAVEM
jgi:hypothetical protein